MAMTGRRHPILLTALLVLLLVFSGPKAGLAGHAGPTGGAGIERIVICADAGMRTIIIDALGNAVEENDEPCCDSPCAVCNQCLDHPGMSPEGFQTLPMSIEDANMAALTNLSQAQPRAPPEN